MDVDGVLTDGSLFHWLAPTGKLVELKGLNAQDGISLVWLVENGVKTGVISGRSSEGLEARARELRMSFVVQGKVHKVPEYERILKESGLRPEETAFIGDDIQDIPLLRRVGWAVAVANARPEVKAAADTVTRASGGRGAVREAAEILLKSQGRWDGILKKFEASR
ncbi:MAG: hypothetical protein A2X36_05175 [Elusimicrobia bacterium GWA2_69_24]|nr:MAG: hypothetical protein A2X36_05175 [Elusimicrobia bacterium GWA2_69_24]HBL18755.1 3-deoxy-D-manno-octulosonate 8-phosphate phosphatase [Elusimicrobiota bacterium]